ncbi:MAG: urate hydroxylase PuuD [Hyphomicrobiaceae bacterium]|nr:urate hydroxylase PuuD [Hyphomicrobiaceae bacterium]MCC0023338.1 urate hydroxylase PuuD [Hyphomicrobiaceae bacterium]
MTDFTIFWEWLNFGVRWLHVVTAIAWIGSSFYFIALDLGLVHRPHLPEGASGEEWQVHGGGFYHIQKYMVAPATMPEHLTWFKWESYSTWLTGFATLALVYYAGADLYLVDRNVLDIPTWAGILLSMASIGVGWVIYDFLCKSALSKSVNGLMVVLFVILVAMAWAYTQVFTGRAAMLHMGAFTATIMTANVFFVIIPNQKIVVADLIAGKKPDPALGIQAKQRSLHNNYLTLPVIFFMLSTHYPLAFATPHNWVIAGLIFLIGVLIRHFFNSMHSRKGRPYWTWAVAAMLFIVIMWLSTGPKLISNDEEGQMTTARAEIFMESPHFRDVADSVLGRCSMCHTAEPFYEGIHEAPKNVHLDNDLAVAMHAREIAIQAGYSTAMPPANVSFMEPEERALIVQWYRESVAKAGSIL